MKHRWKDSKKQHSLNGSKQRIGIKAADRLMLTDIDEGRTESHDLSGAENNVCNGIRDRDIVLQVSYNDLAYCTSGINVQRTAWHKNSLSQRGIGSLTCRQHQKR